MLVEVVCASLEQPPVLVEVVCESLEQPLPAAQDNPTPETGLQHENTQAHHLRGDTSSPPAWRHKLTACVAAQAHHLRGGTSSPPAWRHKLTACVATHKLTACVATLISNSPSVIRIRKNHCYSITNQNTHCEGC